ncbi:hypothetical protein CONLIGDRAFT_682129 [Coniochaeta ligniaria NRRL 30616]|uniref:Zn(2)-C6 fungal-type domain-containing protein n=1 Tax=Coniochaeta ligniaria NRRL 30616 TaxID=1408157 RepID=A0A1J7JHJ9_9PEZI|nr:hypothetical protein CONLIGDRAFT_682129 [Coniochaeta ligniaria NRRL 30616]
MVSPQKKRRLNDGKCASCREDNKKCRPKERTWPGQKCSRCTRKGLPCSENLRDTPTEDNAQQHTPDAETRLGLREAASSDEENWSSGSDNQPGTLSEDGMIRMRQPEFPIKSSSERRESFSSVGPTEFAVGSQLTTW